MNRDISHAGNSLLLKGAALWLWVALVLVWCMVLLKFNFAWLESIFQGEFSRLLQAHLDFLMMSMLLFGFYAAGVALPVPVRWAMVAGGDRVALNLQDAGKITRFTGLNRGGSWRWARS